MISREQFDELMDMLQAARNEDHDNMDLNNPLWMAAEKMFELIFGKDLLVDYLWDETKMMTREELWNEVSKEESR